MDLFDVVKVAARRWYVVIPIVLITLYVAYGQYKSVKPVYYTSVSVGLVSPSVKQQQPIVSGEPVTVTTNGLTDSGGISLLSNLLALAMDDSAIRSQVRAAGGTAAYQTSVFTLPNTAQLPIVVVSASGPNKETVENTVTLAAQQAGPALQGVQAGAGVPAEQMVNAYPLSNVPAAYGALPGRSREAGAVIVGGILIGLIVAVLADALINKVRPRIRNRKNTDATAQPDAQRTAAPAPQSRNAQDTEYERVSAARFAQNSSGGTRGHNGRSDQPRSRT